MGEIFPSPLPASKWSDYDPKSIQNHLFEHFISVTQYSSQLFWINTHKFRIFFLILLLRIRKLSVTVTMTIINRCTRCEIIFFSGSVVTNMSSSLFNHYVHLSCVCCTVAVNVACEHATNFGSCFSFSSSLSLLAFYSILKTWMERDNGQHTRTEHNCTCLRRVFFSFFLYLCLFVLLWFENQDQLFHSFEYCTRTHNVLHIWTSWWSI